MYKKAKRILALITAAIIVLLYLTAFALSFIQTAWAGELLKISLVATVVLPVLLYVYLWLFRLFKKHDDNQ